MESDAQPGLAKSEAGIRAVPETPFLTATRHISAKNLPEVIRDNATREVQEPARRVDVIDCDCDCDCDWA